MPFDLRDSSREPNLSAQQDVETFEIEYVDDVFGPVKSLQLFAAINQLPERFTVRRNETAPGWKVLLCTPVTDQSQRVLSKISMMPAVVDFRRVDADDSETVPAK